MTNKTISNEQKASELSAMYETSFTQDASYFSAMRMAEWKDEQFEKDKQQWIEKVCEWIKNNHDKYKVCNTGILIIGNLHGFNTNKMIDDLTKAMEEGL